MNIHVNIHSSKERALSTDAKNRNVDRLVIDLEDAKADNQILRKRLEHVQVDNQKLSENCRILIEELKASGNEGAKVKQIEKRLAEVDNEYLLTKTISNYDKRSMAVIQKMDIQ